MEGVDAKRASTSVIREMPWRAAKSDERLAGEPGNWFLGADRREYRKAGPDGNGITGLPNQCG